MDKQRFNSIDIFLLYNYNIIMNDIKFQWDDNKNKSKKANLLVVCHCYRESDTIIRIISARKATVRETISYNKNLF